MNGVSLCSIIPLVYRIVVHPVSACICNDQVFDCYRMSACFGCRIEYDLNAKLIIAGTICRLYRCELRRKGHIAVSRRQRCTGGIGCSVLIHPSRKGMVGLCRCVVVRRNATVFNLRCGAVAINNPSDGMRCCFIIYSSIFGIADNFRQLFVCSIEICAVRCPSNEHIAGISAAGLHRCFAGVDRSNTFQNSPCLKFSSVVVLPGNAVSALSVCTAQFIVQPEAAGLVVPVNIVRLVNAGSVVCHLTVAVSVIGQAVIHALFRFNDIVQINVIVGKIERNCFVCITPVCVIPFNVRHILEEFQDIQRVFGRVVSSLIPGQPGFRVLIQLENLNIFYAVLVFINQVVVNHKCCGI